MFKKLFRMVVFSALAILLTQLWNKGFIFQLNIRNLLISSVIIASIYYLIVPLAKKVLFPFNILTLGLLPTLIYCFLFYFFTLKAGWIEIKPWSFIKTPISYPINVILSAVSISSLINLMEFLL